MSNQIFQYIAYDWLPYRPYTHGHCAFQCSRRWQLPASSHQAEHNINLVAQFTSRAAHLGHRHADIQQKPAKLVQQCRRASGPVPEVQGQARGPLAETQAQQPVGGYDVAAAEVMGSFWRLLREQLALQGVDGREGAGCKDHGACCSRNLQCTCGSYAE